MRNRRKRIGCAATLAAVLLLLGGCAMGGAAGNKTVQGNNALDAREYQQAQQLFQEAVKEGEQEMLAYRGLGIAYMGLARYEEAEMAFQAALDYTDDKMPENRQDTELYLATVQYREEKYEETIATCDDILKETSKGNADAYFLRGASYLHEGIQEEAGKDFDAAVAIEQTDYDLYLNIYECYREQNLSGLGGEYLQSALNIPGDDMEHYYNRGRIYYYLENYEEAQRQLIRPVEEKYEPAMYLIGRVYLAMNDYEHAQTIYQQIQSEFGAEAETFNGLALCSIESGDYDMALSYISQGLDTEGTAGKQELYFNEIIAYERKLDFAAAKAKAQEYVQKYPGDEAGQKEWTFLSTR
ncbi:MAG: tetratricopeptide repeat protein [Lachnospiraceae bacterium]|nr:tetratricopeptide repeat protein [Lachnospiraceae bacterium]